MGLSSMLGTQPGMLVVGTLSSGASISDLSHDIQPNVFLIDLRMPGMSGIQCIQQLRFRFPGARSDPFQL